MCCKILEIKTINKPKGQWCQYCLNHSSCSIYTTKPTECSAFSCGYLALPDLPPIWHPATSKIVLSVEGEHSLIAYVDESRPDAWRKEPYISQLRDWSQTALDQGKQVLVSIGSRCIIIFPDSEVDLGQLSQDERIISYESKSAEGPRYHAFKMHKNDPRLSSMIKRSL